NRLVAVAKVARQPFIGDMLQITEQQVAAAGSAQAGGVPSKGRRQRLKIAYIPEQFQREGGDCKSAASWLRRFESCLPHQPSLASRAMAREAQSKSPNEKGKTATPK